MNNSKWFKLFVFRNKMWIMMMYSFEHNKRKIETNLSKDLISHCYTSQTNIVLTEIPTHWTRTVQDRKFCIICLNSKFLSNGRYYQTIYKWITIFNCTLYVEDLEASYLLWRSHAISYQGHFEDGTHKFEDPVSIKTSKVCGGVPIVIGA